MVRDDTEDRRVLEGQGDALELALRAAGSFCWVLNPKRTSSDQRLENVSGTPLRRIARVGPRGVHSTDGKGFMAEEKSF